MKIKYYAIYDSCGKGYKGNSPDGFPIGSYIYKTTNKAKAEKVLKVINEYLPDNVFKASISEMEFCLNEPKEMTEEEIIRWYKKR